MRKLQTALAGAVVLAAVGCGSSNIARLDSTPAPQSGAPGKTGTTVQIDNQNFSDMNVYALQAGQRVLVGQANGLGKTTLVIPTALTPVNGRVRLQADPIGGAGPITTPVLLVPQGQQIYWTIGSDPAMSTVSTG
ncbi:MAG: hypothetical protein QOH59_2526 [Gemmatimonadales bacterium]|jgi:hypothetical protein|nr:hypothetical protein [Gemmatimonadales bacterium]